MPFYSSDSDDVPAIRKGLFGREKTLHALLGGGRAADIVLWREKNLSAAILIGSTLIWSLFEVGEYNFLTLLCYISIIIMFTLLIWSSGAGFVNWNPPDPRAITISESTFHWLFAEMNTIVRLWVIAGIGNYFSSVNLIYTGFLCLMTVPALYERYQKEVEYLAMKGSRGAKKLYRKVDSRFLNKIPRGPLKENKKF